MTDDIEERRLAERRAYRLTLTDDATKLIETLQRESPDAWLSYRRTVDAQGTIEDQTFDTIYRTVLRNFPGRDAQQVSDLLRRMLDMIRKT